MVHWSKLIIPDQLPALKSDEEKKLYRNAECKFRYEKCFESAKVCIERRFAFDSFKLGEVAWIYQRGWKPIMDLEGDVSERYCREFMANVDWKKSCRKSELVSYVRGKTISVTPEIISLKLGVPRKKENVKLPNDVERAKFEGKLNYYDSFTLDWEKICSGICTKETVWPEGTNSKPRSEIEIDYYFQLEATYSIFLPIIGNSSVTKDRARLVYAISHRQWIDLPLYMFCNLFDYAKGIAGKGGIPYGRLLTKLIREKVGGNDLPDCMEEPKKIQKSAQLKAKIRIENEKSRRIAQGKGPSRQLDTKMVDRYLKPEERLYIVEHLTEIASEIAPGFETIQKEQKQTDILVTSLDSIVHHIQQQNQQHDKEFMQLLQEKQKLEPCDVFPDRAKTRDLYRQSNQLERENEELQRKNVTPAHTRYLPINEAETMDASTSAQKVGVGKKQGSGKARKKKQVNKKKPTKKQMERKHELMIKKHLSSEILLKVKALEAKKENGITVWRSRSSRLLFVTSEEIFSILKGDKLGDNTIDAYAELLMTTHRKKREDKFIILRGAIWRYIVGGTEMKKLKERRINKDLAKYYDGSFGTIILPIISEGNEEGKVGNEEADVVHHWTLLVFDMRSMEWCFYNSYKDEENSKDPYQIDAEKVKEEVETAMKQIIMRKSKNIAYLTSKFNAKTIDEVAQQANGSLDCGVFVCFWMECLAKGVDIPTHIPEEELMVFKAKLVSSLLSNFNLETDLEDKPWDAIDSYCYKEDSESDFDENKIYECEDNFLCI